MMVPINSTSKISCRHQAREFDILSDGKSNHYRIDIIGSNSIIIKKKKKFVLMRVGNYCFGACRKLIVAYILVFFSQP